MEGTGDVGSAPVRGKRSTSVFPAVGTPPPPVSLGGLTRGKKIFTTTGGTASVDRPTVKLDSNARTW